MPNISGKMPSIPIIIDKIVKTGSFPMMRCTYFSIECDQPSPNWTLTLNNQEIPFFLLGLSGIISSPIAGGDGSEIFHSEILIDEIFNAIEKNSSLYVDINDIWLPIFVLSEKESERGNVCRLAFDLFKEAYQFRVGQIAAKQLVHACETWPERLTFSSKETIAFQKWSDAQIAEARDQYKKNESMALGWRDDELEERNRL